MPVVGEAQKDFRFWGIIRNAFGTLLTRHCHRLNLSWEAGDGEPARGWMEVGLSAFTAPDSGEQATAIDQRPPLGRNRFIQFNLPVT